MNEALNRNPKKAEMVPDRLVGYKRIILRILRKNNTTDRVTWEEKIKKEEEGDFSPSVFNLACEDILRSLENGQIETIELNTPRELPNIVCNSKEKARSFINFWEEKLQKEMEAGHEKMELNFYHYRIAILKILEEKETASFEDVLNELEDNPDFDIKEFKKAWIWISGEFKTQ